MSKPEIISETKPEEKISVCDIMKTNTSKVIQKFESKIPPRFQQYSDLYAAYLHTIDDVYSTCYISEKEFFDKLNIDQGVLHSIQDYSKTLTDTYLAQIDQILTHKIPHDIHRPHIFFVVHQSSIQLLDFQASQFCQHVVQRESQSQSGALINA